MDLGFLGTGLMGSAMARNLLRAGHSVAVYNRSPEKARALERDGAVVTTSVAAACNGREAVVTMFFNDASVEEVVLGEGGVASALPTGAVHICSSTISTGLARRLLQAHSQKGQKYVSAPVFGRPDAAESKNLVVVTAGEAEAIERCRPVFDAVGRQMLSVGSEPAQANLVKLCGNFMIAVLLETFGEAFANLQKAGVDPHLFLEIINGLFRSPVYQNYGSMIADRRFEPAGALLELGLKDVGLVLRTAEENGAPMPLASVVRDQFLAAMANGQSHLDWSSVSLVAARNAGLSV